MAIDKQQLEEQRDEILDFFDFEIAFRFSQQDDIYPYECVGEMRKTARKELDELIKAYLKGHREFTVATGGFYATMRSDTNIDESEEEVVQLKLFWGLDFENERIYDLHGNRITEN